MAEVAFHLQAMAFLSEDIACEYQKIAMQWHELAESRRRTAFQSDATACRQAKIVSRNYETACLQQEMAIRRPEKPFHQSEAISGRRQAIDQLAKAPAFVLPCFPRRRPAIAAGQAAIGKPG